MSWKPEDDPAIDVEMARSHGLADEEYERACELLGRTPNFTEIGIVSALWSEHCSYKSSRLDLQELPTEGEYVLHGPGENAGVVDIGHDWVAVFKMESHNHPSFLEPYQGAATGVGGILRDVCAMGARPVALLDSLRFGEITGDHEAARYMRHLVDGVVRGIGDYGNCVGVPTVGGETGFHSSYNGNILVNAFALGVARQDRIVTSAARGPGNPIFYVGSRTGRDGIHGATMASESFGAESESKRPTVQVGDPFTEKCLLEACLAVMRTGAVAAIQDMGAAGLTGAALEMAERGDVGIRLELGRVPLRESLTPYEIMLSESQERMLLVATKGREEEVVRVFKHWGLAAENIGEVTSDGMANLYLRPYKAAQMPIKAITENGPVYDRAAAPPADLEKRHAAPEVPVPDDPTAALTGLLGTPELGSKAWIYRQYDHTVRTNTVIGPGGGAAVLLLKGTPGGLGLTSDVNPVYCALDPRRGGRQAVAEAVRNLACIGAEPVGLTDCLNFGNPENPEIIWQFRECVAGMSEACQALEVPVVSGNVSFYNETEGRSVHPTPTVAMVGLIPDLGPLPEAHFTTAGHRLVLLGKDGGEFGGSAYLRLLHGIEQGRAPEVDLEAEENLAALLRFLAFEGWLSTAQDLAEGGLAVGLAEACLSGRTGLGARIRLAETPMNLFSETQARAFVAAPGDKIDAILGDAEEMGVPAVEIGEIGGDRLVIEADGGKIDAAVADLYEVWETALPRALDI